MAYYVMVGEGEHPVHPISKAPRLPGGPWYHGRKLAIAVPAPLEYELDPESGVDCKVKAMYGNKAIPVMRNDLIQVLVSAGVDNLELFPARITNPVTGRVHDDYHAFNIVGLVAAADNEQSIFMDPVAAAGSLDTGYAGLVVDAGKAHGLDLFRMAESCNAICVSEAIRTAVEASGIPGIVFYGPGEWSG